MGRQTTWRSIPDAWKDRTFLVVPMEEMDKHEGIPTIVAPSWVKNYSDKFQWLLDGEFEAQPKAVILDDDLVFSRKLDGRLITERDPNQLASMWEQMEALLDNYPLVGIHPRQMGQNAPVPMVLNGRIICVQGINRELIAPRIKVNQYPILADVVLNCTLLARGYSNALLTTFFQDHGPCQAPGGCSVYRTLDMQKAAVEYLAQRFPGYVKSVERKPKVATWLGDTRIDYTCQWKRLHKAGFNHHFLRTGPNPDRGDA